MNKKNKTTQNSIATVPTPFTAAQVRQMFIDYGITISSFCVDHDLSRTAVVDLIHRGGKGRRGESHRAAVLLGMKADPITKQIRHPFERFEIAA